ncbi:DUF4383 domain-containing protein [Streptomyces calidiresistens]|uniref:DUF4383 domain-containing protein n=1 Tax=Streptomyces calidiresistens TaxID=1485586 RepID=A0A7W3XZ49_9ACTN|nr:DUF4383 domain-containing protein [Streptomyces calidiresistens]MBB0232507.1 DUF4383 domain-containing protein [Streptomyces calidiresistens]
MDMFRNSRAQLHEELPVDHRLSMIYRIGAGLIGAGLIFFGVLGLTERLGVFTTEDNTVLGLSTNGALSVLSIVFGLLLFVGMIKGGNFASDLNIVMGVAFVLSGFVNLALLERDWNILNFGIQNVLFSFVAGLLLMLFGMYGRVTGRLPYDNPYWRSRHPEEAEEAQERKEEAERRRELMDRAQRQGMADPEGRGARRLERAEASREESARRS